MKLAVRIFRVRLRENRMKSRAALLEFCCEVAT